MPRGLPKSTIYVPISNSHSDSWSLLAQVYGIKMRQLMKFSFFFSLLPLFIQLEAFYGKKTWIYLRHVGQNSQALNHSISSLTSLVDLYDCIKFISFPWWYMYLKLCFKLFPSSDVWHRASTWRTRNHYPRHLRLATHKHPMRHQHSRTSLIHDITFVLTETRILLCSLLEKFRNRI